MHHTIKYSKHSSMIWPVWRNGWVLVYKLSGCGFESCFLFVFVVFSVTWLAKPTLHHSDLS